MRWGERGVCIVAQGFVLPRRSGIPPLASSEIAAVGPGDTVLASSSVRVGHLTAAVRPEGVVVSTACAGRVRGSTTAGELFDRIGKDSNDSRGG